MDRIIQRFSEQLKNEFNIFSKHHTIEENISAARLEILYRNLLLTLPASLLCASILLLVLYPITNHALLLGWYFTLVGIKLLRIGMYKWYQFRPNAIKEHTRLFIIGTCLAAATWGVGGALLLPTGHYPEQIFIIIIIVGTTAGALQNLQASFIASACFSTLAICPFVIWLILQSSDTYWLLSIGVLTYYFLCLVLGWRGHELIMETLNLRFKNVELLQDLSTAYFQLEESNKSLLESESRFRLSFNFAAIGMALVSPDGRWLKVNQALCHLVGYPAEELLKNNFQNITYPADLDIDLNYVQLMLSGEINTYQLEKRYIHKKGHLIWVLINVALVKDNNNAPLYFIAQIQNIDAQKKAEAQLKSMAYHDTLTGLINRKQLEVLFNQVLTRAQRYQNTIAVCFLDLDQYKTINDQYGHEAGDILLKVVADRLKNYIRGMDIVCRLGGDEFVIVLTEIVDIEVIAKIAQKIQATINEPISVKDKQVNITASIGISLYPEDGTDLQTLIKNADVALYRVKTHGKNHYKFFSE